MTGADRLLVMTYKRQMRHATWLRSLPSSPSPSRVLLQPGEKFRAEKRSAQASARPLSHAQGRLFCVLTEFDSLFVCH